MCCGSTLQARRSAYRLPVSVSQLAIAARAERVTYTLVAGHQAVRCTSGDDLDVDREESFNRARQRTVLLQSWVVALFSEWVLRGGEGESTDLIAVTTMAAAAKRVEHTITHHQAVEGTSRDGTHALAGQGVDSPGEQLDHLPREGWGGAGRGREGRGVRCGDWMLVAAVMVADGQHVNRCVCACTCERLSPCPSSP